MLPQELTPQGIDLAALLASGTRDGIAIVGPDGKLVFWNAAAAAITGWSLAEAGEQNIGELVKASGALIEIRDGISSIARPVSPEETSLLYSSTKRSPSPSATSVRSAF